MRLFVLVAIAALLGTSAPASAQGMADDSACVMAGLFGEEFGLCNAYCEAMNCDDEVNRQASTKACEKVKSKFEAIAFDPELPCLADPPLNAAPVLDLDAVDDCPDEELCGATATFVSFGDAVPIAVEVEITDTDFEDIIVSATIMLTNQPDEGSGFGDHAPGGCSDDG